MEVLDTTLLKVGKVKETYDMNGAGRSIRGIAEDLGVARNTVRRYLKSPKAVRPKPRARRAPKLHSHTEYVDRRIADEGAAAPEEDAGPLCLGALFPRGPEGGPGQLRQLQGLPLRGAM